jgi:hypothetical protein
MLALSLGFSPLSCSLGPTSPDDDPEPDPAATTRILFVGNSLTYVNDLPGMVKALADSAGIPTVQTAQVAKPDYALEDHWSDGQARTVIAKGGWHYVVMQQGPSAVLANRANLRLWAATFAELIRTKGGTPALYQIWPQLVNFSDFDASSESYRLAAEDVNGCSCRREMPGVRRGRETTRSRSIRPMVCMPPRPAPTWPPSPSSGGIFHRTVVGMPHGISTPQAPFRSRRPRRCCSSRPSTKSTPPSSIPES